MRSRPTGRPSATWLAEMRFAHVNLVVADPERSAQFYAALLPQPSDAVWLGDSLHLRDAGSTDLAFQKGRAAQAPGAHIGFVVMSPAEVERVRALAAELGAEITEDCDEADFQSVKFLDPDGYEIEVYWEAAWPLRPLPPSA